MHSFVVNLSLYSNNLNFNIMKRTFFICLMTILVGFGFTSCKSGDQKIQKDIENNISGLYPDVMVSVNNGVANLAGTVDMESQKRGVEESVKSVKNVKSVVNNIRVLQNSPANTTVNINSDGNLSNIIRNGLDNAGFKGVQIDVRDGDVYLTGDVNRNDLSKVMQIANEASPKRVINQLNIKE